MAEPVDLGTLPQWLSALIAGGALLVARDASKAWQKSLTAKRGDDLILACFDFEAAIGRFRDGLNRQNRSSLTSSISEIYGALLELRKYYVVAQREYDSLGDDTIKSVEDCVATLRDEFDLRKNLDDGALAFGVEAPAKGWGASRKSIGDRKK